MNPTFVCGSILFTYSCSLMESELKFLWTIQRGTTHHFMVMKCFQFYSGERKDEPKTPTANNSLQSSFTDHEIKQSGSELNSQDVSNTSSESRGRNQFPNLSERASYLKVFSFSELKQVTKNFGRTTKLGEGGFGCVFKGVIKSSDDPAEKIDVAVKQLGKRGLQVHFL